MVTAAACARRPQYACARPVPPCCTGAGWLVAGEARVHVHWSESPDVAAAGLARQRPASAATTMRTGAAAATVWLASPARLAAPRGSIASPETAKEAPESLARGHADTQWHRQKPGGGLRSDALVRGRRIRMLAIIDTWNRAVSAHRGRLLAGGCSRGASARAIATTRTAPQSGSSGWTRTSGCDFA